MLKISRLEFSLKIIFRPNSIKASSLSCTAELYSKPNFRLISFKNGKFFSSILLNSVKALYIFYNSSDDHLKVLPKMNFSKQFLVFSSFISLIYMANLQGWLHYLGYFSLKNSVSKTELSMTVNFNNFRFYNP
jgi:hypothetical protein